MALVYFSLDAWEEPLNEQEDEYLRQLGKITRPSLALPPVHKCTRCHKTISINASGLSILASLNFYFCVF